MNKYYSGEQFVDIDIGTDIYIGIDRDRDRDRGISIGIYIGTYRHSWELLGNYPVFTMVIVIYPYVERIWRILVTPNFLYNIHNHG